MANEDGKKKKSGGQPAKLKKISSGTRSEKIKIPREIRRTMKKVEKHTKKGLPTAGLLHHLDVLAEQKKNARNKNSLR
jgi:hypothetical protein